MATKIPDCEACHTNGWLMNQHGTIERCDLCEAFETDDHAQEWVNQAAVAFAELTRGEDCPRLSCVNPYELKLDSGYAQAKQLLDSFCCDF